MTQKTRLLGAENKVGRHVRVQVGNSDAMQRSERLRVAVKEGGGAKEVSRRSGTAPSTLHSYLSGQDMKLSQVVALADACGVSVEWLARGRGPMRLEETPVPTDKPTEAAVNAVRAALGAPQLMQELPRQKPKYPLHPITEFMLLANCLNHVFAQMGRKQEVSLGTWLRWAIDLYDAGGPVVQAIPFDQLPESPEGDNAESGGPRAVHGE